MTFDDKFDISLALSITVTMNPKAAAERILELDKKQPVTRYQDFRQRQEIAIITPQIASRYLEAIDLLKLAEKFYSDEYNDYGLIPADVNRWETLQKFLAEHEDKK